MDWSHRSRIYTWRNLKSRLAAVAQWLRAVWQSALCGGIGFHLRYLGKGSTGRRLGNGKETWERRDDSGAAKTSFLSILNFSKFLFFSKKIFFQQEK